MSARTETVERYIDGFREGDHAKILDCLTDDVVWLIHGSRELVGKEAFDGEIENEATPGLPLLSIRRLIEDGDTVVALGAGEASLRDGGRLEFVFTDIFDFRLGKISRVETYLVTLGGGI